MLAKHSVGMVTSRSQLQQATDFGWVAFFSKASVSLSLKWIRWLLSPWRVATAFTGLLILQTYQQPSHDSSTVLTLGGGTPLYTALTPDLSNLQQHYSDHYDRDCIFMAGL